MRYGIFQRLPPPNLPFEVSTLGGVTTTANPLYTARELANQLNDSKASVIVTIAPFIEKVFFY